MLKSQMKFQKIVVLILLIMCVVMFIYSLGIMTDPYKTLYNVYDPDLDEEDSSQFAPAKLFFDMQGFNNTFMMFSLILLILSLSMFAVHMSTRRRYYIGNYIVTGAVSVASLAFSIWASISLFSYRNLYSGINLADLEAAAIVKGQDYYEPSMFWFDLGIVLCALFIVAAIALILNLIWKRNLMKKEDALLAGNTSIASIA